MSITINGINAITTLCHRQVFFLLENENGVRCEESLLFLYI